MTKVMVANGSPEEFLRGALEKIVFFECRVSQLNAELTAERAVVIREKEAAASARAREVEHEMLLTRTRSELSAMKSRAVELEERVRLLEAERERFLSGLVERAQVAGAPSGHESETPGEQTDLAALAGFIAELRSNIEHLKLWKAAAIKAGITVDDETVPEPVMPVPPVSTLAAGFEKGGRLGVAADETDRMKEQLTTRAERSLYEASMEDLATADPGRRKRAADCLRALGSPAAAPLVAAALGREGDHTVKAALLSALAVIGKPSAVDLALREIGDTRPEVRAAALEAAATLAKESAEPALVAALGDPSSLVRRRAVLLLGFMASDSVVDALVTMLSDRDPRVARTAAMALSGKPNLRAQAALAKALDHRESTVRRCAADAVARWSGEAIDPDSPSAERRRTARRIADRLAKLEEGILRKAVIQVPEIGGGGNLPKTAIPERETGTGSSLPMNKEEIVIADTVTTPRSPRSGMEVSMSRASPLETALVGEIRSSLRGRTAEELSQLADTELKAVTASLAMLVRQGTLSQRGPRFFIS